jgi:medium-chain acyl-[acyl-carrier-protein] hydrolase
MTQSISANATQASTWLPQFKPNSRARIRLFCFPYAGGGSLTYRNWAEKLPPSVEVCPVDLPGRGRRLREQAFTNLDDLVRAAAVALQPRLYEPFAFFGHSMGAIISFELARLIKQEYGLKPLHVFVSSRRAPQCPSDEPSTYDLPQVEFIEDLRRLNGTPKEVLEHPELLQVLLPILRSDFEVCQTYRYLPGPPLECPITAFGGALDADVTRTHMEGWREMTSAGFKLFMSPGDHFHINSFQPQLLHTLSTELEAVVSLLGR